MLDIEHEVERQTVAIELGDIVAEVEVATWADGVGHAAAVDPWLQSVGCRQGQFVGNPHLGNRNHFMIVSRGAIDHRITGRWRRGGIDCP
ncbi:hypothetical protein D3C77_493380 [compost metagenome]